MLVTHTLHTVVPGRVARVPVRNRRFQVALVAVGIALLAERVTTVPGLRMLLAAVVVVGPAVLFERFWRFLVLLREADIDGVLARRRDHGWRGWRLLWPAFVGVWALDLAATVWFFYVPGVSELHPVTVFLYEVVGVPGVLAAGTAYALVAVAVVRALPSPRDFDFLLAATLWYGLLVVHNYVLLLGGRT